MGMVRAVWGGWQGQKANTTYERMTKGKGSLELQERNMSKRRPRGKGQLLKYKNTFYKLKRLTIPVTIQCQEVFLGFSRSHCGHQVCGVTKFLAPCVSCFYLCIQDLASRLYTALEKSLLNVHILIGIKHKEDGLEGPSDSWETLALPCWWCIPVIPAKITSLSTAWATQQQESQVEK